MSVFVNVIFLVFLSFFNYFFIYIFIVYFFPCLYVCLKSWLSVFANISPSFSASFNSFLSFLSLSVCLYRSGCLCSSICPLHSPSQSSLTCHSFHLLISHTTLAPPPPVSLYVTSAYNHPVCLMPHTHTNRIISTRQHAYHLRLYAEHK